MTASNAWLASLPLAAKCLPFGVKKGRPLVLLAPRFLRLITHSSLLVYPLYLQSAYHTSIYISLESWNTPLESGDSTDEKKGKRKRKYASQHPCRLHPHRGHRVCAVFGRSSNLYVALLVWLFNRCGFKFVC